MKNGKIIGRTTVAALGIASVFLAVRLGAQEPPRPAAPSAAGRPPAFRGRPPVQRLSLFLDGFHVRDGARDKQTEAAHFCAAIGAELQQCAIFDSRAEGARLIGVEYVISARGLSRLPESERALWHSHAQSVFSGEMVAPGLPHADERELMETLVGTYGKAWHTWLPQQNGEVPLGRPALMMSSVESERSLPELVAKRDHSLNLSTDEARARRVDIRPPQLLPGADRGEGGRSCFPGDELSKLTPPGKRPKRR